VSEIEISEADREAAKAYAEQLPETLLCDALICELAEAFTRHRLAATAAGEAKSVDAERILAWIKDPNRKPTALAFTRGFEREIADWIIVKFGTYAETRLRGPMKAETVACISELQAAYDRLSADGKWNPMILHGFQKAMDVLQPTPTPEANQ